MLTASGRKVHGQQLLWLHPWQMPSQARPVHYCFKRVPLKAKLVVTLFWRAAAHLGILGAPGELHHDGGHAPQRRS